MKSSDNYSSDTDRLYYEYALRSIDPHAYYRNFLKHSHRRDGREFSSYRNLSCELNTITGSNIIGSAEVSFGETKVLAVVTAKTTSPHIESPNCGVIDFQASIGVISSDKLQEDKKNDEICSIETWLANAIVGSGAVDLRQLIIEEGRYAFQLTVHITSLSLDGNFDDAAVIAAIQALKQSKLPEVIFEKNVLKLQSKYMKNVKIEFLPIPISIGIFDDNYSLIDVNAEEEELCHIKSIVFDDCDNIKCMRDFHNSTRDSGFIGVSVERNATLIELARNKAKWLRQQSIFIK